MANLGWNKGFTLIEVLVALLIVGVALSALLLRVGSFVDNTAYLRDKTIAHWVAMNQLELARLANQASNQLVSDEIFGTDEMAGRQWDWRIKPKKTAAEGFQQLEVTVFYVNESESSLVTLVGFVDQYHKL